MPESFKTIILFKKIYYKITVLNFTTRTLIFKQLFCTGFKDLKNTRLKIPPKPQELLNFQTKSESKLYISQMHFYLSKQQAEKDRVLNEMYRGDQTALSLLADTCVRGAEMWCPVEPQSRQHLIF